MKAPRFSLKTLFVLLTLTCICSNCLAFSWVEKIHWREGRGSLLHVGWLEVGAKNMRNDGHGWYAGAWWKVYSSRPDKSVQTLRMPLLVVPLGGDD